MAELPAVIGAADAVVGRDAVGERGAAVRALLGDQADAALLVAEQHQVLAEQADALVPLAVKLGDRRDRVPVAAHHVAARRAGSDAGEQFVLLGGQHRCGLLFMRFPAVYSRAASVTRRAAVRAGMSGKIRIGIVGMGAAGWAFRSGDSRQSRHSSWRRSRNRPPRCARPWRRKPASRCIPTCRRCCGTPRSTRSISRRRPSCIPSMSRRPAPRRSTC